MPSGWLHHDVATVHRAAGLLRVPEFAFFRLAYRGRHGRACTTAIEPVFMSHRAGHALRHRL
jgi:hypothetical protein